MWQKPHLLSQNLFPSEHNLPARENIHWNKRILARGKSRVLPTDPGGVLPYMGYIGMCRCEGYGFQAVYSGIGYINQSVWV